MATVATISDIKGKGKTVTSDLTSPELKMINETAGNMIARPTVQPVATRWFNMSSSWAPPGMVLYISRK